MIPALEKFLQAEKEKRITAHRQGDLVGFKYTNETVYSQDWDEVTLNARGVVFNEKTGEIVARPFKKFFNYQEFWEEDNIPSTLFSKLPNEFLPDISGHFRVMEKADGSLGIVFFNPLTKHWQVKTGGSFDSDQAIWAQKWFDKNINTELLIDGFTYLFEIISNEDIHPIKYDFEGLVLLGAISNDTGIEVPLTQIQNISNRLNVRMVKIYEFKTFHEIIGWSKALPKTQEGVVVTFDNGFKTKLKGDEWCKLARAFEGMTKWNIWVSYDIAGDYFHANVDKHNGYKPIDDEVLFIPEELKEMRAYAEEIRNSVQELTTKIMDMAKETKLAASDRKLQFEYCQTHYKEYTAGVMKALSVLDGKCDIVRIKQFAHKFIKPEPSENDSV